MYYQILINIIPNIPVFILLVVDDGMVDILGQIQQSMGPKPLLSVYMGEYIWIDIITIFYNH